MRMPTMLRAIAENLRTWSAGVADQQLTPAAMAVAVTTAAGELQAAALDLERLGPCWTPATVPPAAHPDGDHLPVEVLGVVDDPRLRLHADEKPFWDRVAWWPARKVWTVTHQCRADGDAGDFEVHVAAWQPAPALPARGGVWR